MDENWIKCFICDVPCLAVNKHHGSIIASTLAMPLTAVLEKCLRIIADIENEYFCVKCTNKIEEYDELLKKSRHIEKDLYEQFQNKAMKCEFDETVIIVDRNNINEILIHTDEPEFKSEITVTQLNEIEDDEDYEEFVKEEVQFYEEIHKSHKKNKQAENIKSRKSAEVEVKAKKVQSTKKTPSSNNKILAKKNKPAEILESRKSAEVDANTKKTPSTNTIPAKKRHYRVESVTCDICGRIYQSKGALTVHLVKHVERSPHGKLH